jgi:hypothetical protein
MPLWGKIDQANNAPKYAINSTSPNTGIQLFGTQVVGLDDGEVAASPRANHTGWTRVQRGTGPVTSFTIGAAGTGYTNGHVAVVSGGTVNAVATVATNGSGGITSLTITESGSGFANVSSTTTAIRVSVGGAASGGTGATVTPVLGGRAGRVQVETLVALSGMTANNSTLAG